MRDTNQYVTRDLPVKSGQLCTSWVTRLYSQRAAVDATIRSWQLHIPMVNRIADYALIGDGQTAALVGKNGAIDWLCVPRFDSPACFAALLGSAENGQWQIQPMVRARIVRRYVPHTLVLETEFTTAEGTVKLIDFMPWRDKNPRVVRQVRGERGTVRLRIDLVIRVDYGQTVPWMRQESKHVVSAVVGPNRFMLRGSIPLKTERHQARMEFSVKAGETVEFELEYESSFPPVDSSGKIKPRLKATEDAWRRWVALGKYRGPYADAVERSLITLKALIYAPSGGMLAAPTTSLPEQPGGKRNWDYRYCWVRDATFTLLGLVHAGYQTEARRWKDWLVRATAGSARQIQVLYGAGGERVVKEWNAQWLPGYQDSLPVRVGNSASEQFQLDMYGEIADALHQVRSSTQAERNQLEFELQFRLLEYLQKVWRQPDHGIWEKRSRVRQYTESKVMAWVAFDRVIRNIEQAAWDAPLSRWCSLRQQIHEDVCRMGFDPRLGSFTTSYGSQDVDASLLLLPLVGFLPPSDPRIAGTVRIIEKRLMRGGLVMRSESSIRGGTVEEGAFLPCSFWLADYYELIGRRKEAVALLNRLLKLRNDVGLLSEEYHPAKKQLVGNFPQALTHVALINTVINLYTNRGPARRRSNAHTRQEPLL